MTRTTRETRNVRKVKLTLAALKYPGDVLSIEVDAESGNQMQRRSSELVSVPEPKLASSTA